MNLSKTNLIKIFLLTVIKKLGGKAELEELNYQRIVYSIDDVSRDLLLKTLYSMSEEGLIDIHSNEYHTIMITKIGEEYLRNKVLNLYDFMSFVCNDFDLKKSTRSIPELLMKQLSSIKALKTVIYRLDSLNGLNEDDFFKSKKGTPYSFDNRKLGKSRYVLTYCPELNPYDYSIGYVILFVNSGLIRFIGFVADYNNTDNELYFNSIVKLHEPISILDIRQNVRENYNNSQQKQEFIDKEEVNRFITLIQNKLNNGGFNILF